MTRDIAHGPDSPRSASGLDSADSPRCPCCNDWLLSYDHVACIDALAPLRGVQRVSVRLSRDFMENYSEYVLDDVKAL